MKKLWIIVLALVAIQVTAQNKKTELHKAKMERVNDMTPEEMVQLQTKRMTLQLDLTETQQAEVEKLLLDDAKVRKEKMASFKAKNETGEMKKPSKEDRLKMINERLDRQIEMKKKMKAILNDEQYKKWDAMQEKKQFHKSEMNVKEMHKEK
ncbi:MAG: hypothetical protein R2812_04740 [Gelidibacter sp.]